MDTMMQMFFTKVEAEYGVSRGKLFACWREFNMLAEQKFCQLVPNPEGSFTDKRCQTVISKGDRMGLTCNAFVVENTDACKKHAKSGKSDKGARSGKTGKAARSGRADTASHQCEHILDVNTDKRCSNRAAVNETVCNKHVKFYDANGARLPMCQHVTSNHNRCNKNADDETGYCSSHYNQLQREAIAKTARDDKERQKADRQAQRERAAAAKIQNHANNADEDEPSTSTAQPQPKPKPESKSKAESKSKVESKSKAQSQSKAKEPEPEPEPEYEDGSEPEAELESEQGLELSDDDCDTLEQVEEAPRVRKYSMVYDDADDDDDSEDDDGDEEEQDYD